MIKFIIIEDNPIINEKIKKILRQVSIKNDKELEVLYFPKLNKNLQKEIKDDLYHKVYLIDIPTKEDKTKIQLAEKIRKEDLESEMIFVTREEDLFKIIHQKIVQVFDFVENKQDFENRLKKDFQILLNKKIDKNMLKISLRHRNFEIYMKNILYITRDKKERKVVIYTDKENTIFKINSSLKEMKELLDERFVMTHKSCIANKQRMIERNYSKHYFVLDNGKKVELLSPKYRDSIEQTEPSCENTYS